MARLSALFVILLAFCALPGCLSQAPPVSEGTTDEAPAQPPVREDKSPGPPTPSTPDLSASLPSPARSRSVHTQAVCFTAHNPPDEVNTGIVEHRLFGMRFNTTPLTPSSIAILLLSGGGHPWRYWDHDEGLSVARGLARAGYVVFAYDRLGYLGSRPPSHYAAAVTAMQHVDMTLEVAAQVRAGTYLESSGDDCTASTAPASPVPVRALVVAGQSLGSMYGLALAARSPGMVDALVEGELPHFGGNPSALVLLAKAATTVDAEGYVTFPVDTADCLQLIFYAPGADQDVMDAYCDPVLEGNVPSGELASLTDLEAQNRQAIAQLPADLPVLFTWGDHSYFTQPGDPEREVQAWQAICPCKDHLESWIQMDSGHDFNLHRSAPTWTAHVVDWLARNGLPPAN